MTDRVGITLCDQSILEQMQTPTPLAFGRSRADGGDQAGFSSAIQQTGFAVRLFFPVESRLEAALGKTAAHIVDGDIADVNLFTYSLVVGGSFGAVGIGQQENGGALALQSRVLVGAGDAFGFLVLLWCECNQILFGGH